MLFIVPIIGLLGLLFAIMLRLHVIKQDPGNQKMGEITDAVAEGARAFLTLECHILIIFVAPLSVVIGFGTGSWVTAGCFLVGGLSSTAAGYLGMNATIRANCRTASTARTPGIRGTLALTFSSGSVMGMAVVGLELMGIGALYAIIRDVSILSGLSLGVPSIALFTHVGGGVCTKAADVDTDLVGKVEAGIPKDDPRDSVAVTGNVGDNVGDVAGMGVDLSGPYVDSLISVLILGLVFYQESGIIFPLLFFTCGIVAPIIGALLVKVIGGMDPHEALKTGGYSAIALVVIVALALSHTFFGNYLVTLTVIIGLFVGMLIGFVTEIYTSGDYRFVKRAAGQPGIGSTTTIISSLTVGVQSTAVPTLLVYIGILISNRLMGLYGIVPTTVGMLSTTGVAIAVDAYGPTADSAGGIAEMAGLDKSVRGITDRPDSVGNTMAAVGKGLAIGSTALTALVLFVSYAEAVKLTTIDILNVHVIVGFFIGGMLTFLLSAMTMESISKTAHQMTEEVRHQSRENSQILRENACSNYAPCVSISTTAALGKMSLPGLMTMLVPLATGVILGPDVLGGFLTGSLVTDIFMVAFISNFDRAWDNVKRYIEEDDHGGKGSMVHKVAAIDDTVGNPFKGISGPFINILIKLMITVSFASASLFLQYGGLI